MPNREYAKLTLQMRLELEDKIRQENAKRTEIDDLKERLDILKEENMQLYNQASGYNVIFERVDTLNKRLEMLNKNKDRMKIGMTELKGESLWQETHGD